MHPGQLSDEVLAARVAQGDRTAFETLYDRHASIVLGITLRITGERAIAEDLLQETFWRMWQGAVTYRPQHGSFTDWLFRIARNLAIDVHQQRGVHPKASMDATEANSNTNERESAQSNFKAQQVQNALQTLPPQQRQVIELAYFSGMTCQEIAKTTGELPAAIQTQARLGIQKLREALEREEFEF